MPLCEMDRYEVLLGARDVQPQETSSPSFDLAAMRESPPAATIAEFWNWEEIKRAGKALLRSRRIDLDEEKAGGTTARCDPAAVPPSGYGRCGTAISPPLPLIDRGHCKSGLPAPFPWRPVS